MRKFLRSDTDDFASVRVEPAFFHAKNMTKSRTIGVLAHPSTFTQHSYDQLKLRGVSGITIIEPDCHGWSDLIDRNLSHHIDLVAVIGELIRWQTDIIVIASSSYSSLRSRIEAIAGPSVPVLDSLDYT